MKSDITGIILSRPKSKMLKEAIQSLQWCHEVLIVVDGDESPSFDKLPTNVRVLHHTLNNDYAAQRNFALSEARTTWVLFIDDDEVVSEALANEIKEAVQKKNAQGYLLRRTDAFMGKTLMHGETGSVKLLRLAKRGAGEWVRPVHEVWMIKGAVLTLTHALKHNPHASVSSFIEKINSYTSIEADYRRNIKKACSTQELFLFPPLKFIYNYIIKFGFLDGFPGLTMALLMSLHSFVVRVKIREYAHIS